MLMRKSLLALTFQLSFDVGIVTIFGGRLDERRKAELRRNYSVVEKGYNCFPNSLPGTLYHKAMQVRDGIQSQLLYLSSTFRAFPAVSIGRQLELGSRHGRPGGAR